MICTIMSDASVCPNTGASGYGLWIKSDRGTFQGGGNYKKSTTDVTEAEAKAMYNAVFIAFSQGLAKEGDTLIIQIDCKYAIDAINGRYHGGNVQIMSLAKKAKRFLDKSKCEYQLRYVKAHNPQLGNRNYVNEICDSLAKTAMRKQRKELSA